MITNTQKDNMKNQYYNNGIGKKEIRSYEVSLWTLLDEFITVLKWSDVEQKGRIENPKMILDVDGTEEFSFSIPMYYYNHLGEWTVNPNWHNVEDGNLITSLRKIKVIFNKYEDEEAVYEFLITEVTETHNDNDTLICEVKCEGLAFHELGKIGYKFKLSPEDYELDYKEWAEDDNRQADLEPINNIDYWCGGEHGLKLEKVSKNDLLPDSRKWYYQIDMNWSSFKGTTSRDNAKLYEESYATAWDSNLHPTTYKNYAEKRRSISIENSNIYNITLTIAETFGVFCRYQYDHDENYHISGRRIIFYNNFFLEELSSPLSFSYPHSASRISRSMDGKDLTTKLYVLNVENSDSVEGAYTIMNSEANKTMEDYILNFDYLHDIHAITEELYQEINTYEKKMREYNQKLIPILYNLEEYRRLKPEVEAKQKVAANAITLDLELIDGNLDKLNALDVADGDPDGYISKTGDNSTISIIIEGKNAEGNTAYYVSIREKGVSLDTIKIYKTKEDATNANGTGEFDILNIDMDSNPVKVYINKPNNLENNYVYASYKYNPQLYYEGIITEWQTKKAQDTENETKYGQELSIIKDKITELEALVKEISDAKSEVIEEFNAMMGPALREGYWQPEDYSDYGNHENFNSILNVYNWPTTLPKAAFSWDNETFDEELSLTYKLGITLLEKYYPCINLSFWFTDPLYVNEDITKYSFIYKCNYKETDVNNTSIGTKASDIKIFAVGAGALLCFVKNSSGTVFPALLLTGAKTLSNDLLTFVLSTASLVAKGYPYFGLYEPIKDQLGNYTNGFTLPKKTLVLNYSDYWTFGGSTINNCTIVYPRIKLTEAGLKKDTTNLVLHYEKTSGNKTLLEYPNHYYINNRNTKYLNNGQENYALEYFITLKPITIMNLPSGAFASSKIDVDYVISNANTAIYLDALEVSKENAYPKVSYDIDVNTLFNIGADAEQEVNYEFSKILYNRLALLAMINDAELKFLNTFGYISHVELDLDNIVNDTVEIMNYKTKFEDLFSTIVASTEAMKRTSSGLASVIGGSTPLSGEGLASTITNNYSILDAYLDSHFDSSEVVRNKLTELFTEAGLILADSSNTLNKMSTLTIKNADILASFALDIGSELTGKVFRLKELPTTFKVGDIWIELDNNSKDIAHYVATYNSSETNEGGGWIRTYDGTLALIKGASLNVDAVAGTVDIEAENLINIKSGHNVYIAANERVDIVGNKEVNIGGTTINLATSGGKTSGINLVSTGINFNDNNGHIDPKTQFDSAIASTSTTISKVLINPNKIEMGSADIIMRGANKILMITSRGDVLNTSAISIDPEDGVWIGSGAGVNLYSGNIQLVELQDGTFKPASGVGTSVELLPDHLLFGVSNTNGETTAVEMTDEYIVLGKGNVINTTTNNKIDTGITGNSNGLIGAKFTTNSIGFATLNNSIVNAVIMNDNGITLGSGFTNVNLATATKEELRNASAESGSYVRIANDGIELGSLADLYINTDNFKLLTHSREKGNNGAYTDGDTILAIGRGLLNVGYDTALSTILAWDQDEDNILDARLVLNKNGLYIKGNVCATAFIASAANGYMKADANNFGFYDTSNNAILTIGNDGTITASKKLSITADNLYIGTNNFTNIKLTMENEAIVESIVLYRATGSDTYSSTNPLISNAGTTTADNNWTQNVPAVSSTNKYLWSVLRNKNGAGIYTYGVPKLEGVLDNLTEVTYKEYARSNSNTVAPDITDDSLWFTKIPDLTTNNSTDNNSHTVHGYSNPYVWTTTKTVKVNGTASRTTPVLDSSLSGISLAMIDALNIASGAIAVPHVETTGITIDNGNLTVGATASLSIIGNHEVKLYSAANGTNNALLLNGNGISIASRLSIAIASGATIDINSTNFIVNSAATEGAVIFLAGNTSEYIKFYSAITGLSPVAAHLDIKGKITATELTIGDKSASQFVKDNQNNPNLDEYATYSDFDVSGNITGKARISASVWNTLGKGTALKMTDGSLLIGTTTNGAFTSDITINDNGISLTSGKYLVISTSNFGLTTDGTATINAGKIGNWTIENEWLYGGSTSDCVTLVGADAASHNITGRTHVNLNTWAMYAGAAWPEEPGNSSLTNATPYGWAPFRVSRNGYVYGQNICVGNGPHELGNEVNAFLNRGQSDLFDGDWSNYTGYLWFWVEGTDTYTDSNGTEHNNEKCWRWIRIDGLLLYNMIESIQTLQKAVKNLLNSASVPAGDLVSEKAKSTRGCFVKGTLVKLYDNSFIPIELLQVGMKVLAYNENDHKFYEDEVEVILMLKHKNNIYDLYLSSGKKITMTGSHPILTTNGWKSLDIEGSLLDHGVEVTQLFEGDQIITCQNEPLYVNKIVFREDLLDETVYNCHIEKYHTFVVEDAVVHNTFNAVKTKA